jgi:hypothetical protein
MLDVQSSSYFEDIWRLNLKCFNVLVTINMQQHAKPLALDKFQRPQNSWTHDILYPCPVLCKDFRTHAQECDALLQHYVQQFRDREVYWLAREYSRAREGLLTVIIDSYDKAKLSLPRWPFGRVPKKSLYEETRRTSAVQPVFFLVCGPKNHDTVLSLEVMLFC